MGGREPVPQVRERQHASGSSGRSAKPGERAAAVTRAAAVPAAVAAGAAQTAAPVAVRQQRHAEQLGCQLAVAGVLWKWKQ